MSKTFIYSLLFFVSALFAMRVTAQGNAHIRRDTILQVLPGYEQQVRSLDSMKTAFTEEIKMESAKLDKKVSDLLTPYSPKANETAEGLVGRMSQVDATRYSLLQKESLQLDELSKSYSQILEMQYKNKIQPLVDKLNKTIEGYAVKNKYDMIFILEEIAPALAYVNKGKDVTMPVIQLLLAK